MTVQLTEGLFEGLTSLFKRYGQASSKLDLEQSAKYFEAIFAMADALFLIDPPDGEIKENYDADVNCFVAEMAISTAGKIIDPFNKGHADSFMKMVAKLTTKIPRLHDGLQDFYAYYDTPDGLILAMKNDPDYVIANKIMTLVNELG